MDNPSELPKKASFTVFFLHAPSRSPCRLLQISPPPSLSSVSPYHLTPRSPRTSGLQTVALISTGLIPSHFLKDFNYCLLHWLLSSANACISPVRAHACEHAKGTHAHARMHASTHTGKAFSPLLCTRSGTTYKRFLNKPDKRFNGCDEQRFTGPAEAFTEVCSQRVQGASHVHPTRHTTTTSPFLSCFNLSPPHPLLPLSTPCKLQADPSNLPSFFLLVFSSCSSSCLLPFASV